MITRKNETEDKALMKMGLNVLLIALVFIFDIWLLDMCLRAMSYPSMVGFLVGSVSLLLILFLNFLFYIRCIKGKFKIIEKDDD